VSRNTSSAYADCQRRKFDVRCSPDDRTNRSTSGSSWVYRWRWIVFSVMPDGFSLPAATSSAMPRTAS
jgi:hypothetical protein